MTGYPQNEMPDLTVKTCTPLRATAPKCRSKNCHTGTDCRLNRSRRLGATRVLCYPEPEECTGSLRLRARLGSPLEVFAFVCCVVLYSKKEQ